MLFIDASMFTCKYCFSGVTLLVDAALVERKLSEYEDLEVDALFDFDLGYTEEQSCYVRWLQLTLKSTTSVSKSIHFKLREDELLTLQMKHLPPEESLSVYTLTYRTAGKASVKTK